MNASRRLAFGSHYPGLIVPARRHGKTFKILFLALDLPAQWLVTVALGIHACHCVFFGGNFANSCPLCTILSYPVKSSLRLIRNGKNFSSGRSERSCILQIR